MKKILSLILCAILMLCACPALAETFSATEAGFGGDVTVTLTVEDGAVTNVEIVGLSETADLGGMAMPAMAEEILAAQSPYVDAYTGATMTSTAVLAAAEKAFAEAGIAVEAPEVVKGEDKSR